MAEEMQDEKLFSPPNPNLDYQKLYQPLGAQNSKRIRLLELLPGKHDESICCRLIQNVGLPSHPDLNSSTSFEALSYCAGAASDYMQILVDGLSFNSFASLSGALRKFRFEDCSRVLWADQICINQTDIAERNGQVAMMADIYSAASKVLIWTGESCTISKSQLVYDFVDTFLQIHGTALEKVQKDFVIEGESQDAAVKRWLQRFFTGQDLTPLPSSHNLEPIRNSIVNLLCSPDTLTLWRAMERFLSRPYWSRVWIIQEVVLSSDALVVCGFNSCKLLDFVSVMAVLMYVIREKVWDGYENSLPEFAANVRSVLVAWYRHANCVFQIWSRFGSTPLHLLSNLTLTEEFCSTDPRDRIYALLGLLPESDRSKLDIFIDYSKENSPMHTLIHVAKAWIVSGSGLLILGFIRGDEVNLGLPSWVPNFLEKRNGIPRGVYSHVHEANWKACGPTQVRSKFMSNGRIAMLEGIIVAQIREESRLGIVDSIGDYNKHLDHVNIIRSWQGLVEQIHPEPTAKTWHDFWRTLSMDFFVEVRDEEDPALWESQYFSAVKKCRGRFTTGRRFSILPNSLMGLFPKETQNDDVVAIFSGGHVPFVIRARADAPMFRLIGECYVSKIMYGAAMMNHLKHCRPFIEIALS